MAPPVIPPSVVQEPPVPLAASKVVDLLTGLVSDVTLIPRTLVRPRWQPIPPQQPPPKTDWCGVGILRRLGQGYTHQSIAFLPGTTTEALLLRRWEALEALASFYGPRSEDLAEQFRDSVFVVQNLAALYQFGIKLTWVDEVLAVPDLTNHQWIDHNDVRFELAREVDRYFPLKSVLKGVGSVIDDDGYLVNLDSSEGH